MLFRRGGGEARTVSILQNSKSFPVSGKDSILNEALAAGIPFPHSCTVGTCGSCKVRLVDGKIREIRDSALALSGAEIRGGYILACQSVAKTSLTLDVAGLADLPDHPLVHVEGEIESLRPLTHDILEVGIRLAGPMEYTAGQYGELSVAGIAVPRAYSFADAPNRREKDRVTFYIRKVDGGELTEWLFGADRTGAQVGVAGPFGDLWLRPGSAPVLCAAGGSGLAPIKSLVEQACDDAVDREFVVVFGARRERDVYCAQELQALAGAAGMRLTFVPVLSEEEPAVGSPWGRGLVTDAIAELPGEFLDACDVYACGPPPMVDAVEALLLPRREDAAFFHADRFLDKSSRGAA